MLKTTIIIVTYNGMKWINDCLLSCKSYPVIVIDNCSTDSTVEFIDKNYPNVEVHKQNKNLGFGQANNLGISIALKQGADFVFLLNQDAYLHEGTITKLIKIYKSNLKYGILSPIHLNGNGTKLDKSFASYLEQDQNRYLYFDAIVNNIKDIYEVPFVNAAAWLVPKKTITTIGGFDPLFFHYGEDDNYCQRVIFHNLKIGVVPNTYVNHDREFRDKPIMIKFSPEYFNKMEIHYKVKFGNLNLKNANEEYLAEKKKLVNLRVRLLLKLRLKLFKKYSKLIRILDKTYEKSSKSKIINKKKSAHYINFND